jgi:Transposase/HTH-like domain
MPGPQVIPTGREQSAGMSGSRRDDLRRVVKTGDVQTSSQKLPLGNEPSYAGQGLLICDLRWQNGSVSSGPRPKENSREEKSLHRGANRRHPQGARRRHGATELARRHGIHANTIRQWRDKYAGLETSDLTRLKQLEAGSARKDRVIARLTMEVDAVRELISKNGWSPRSYKEAVRVLQEFGISQVRACAIVGQPRRTLHYRGKPKDDGPIAERTQTLAQERPRWGWRRLLIMIHRDGIDVGEYRFRRIYRSLALQVRPRKKRKVRYVRGNVIAAERAMVHRLRARSIGERSKYSRYHAR